MTTMTKDQRPTSDALGAGEKKYSENLTWIGDVPRVNWFKASVEREMTPIWENLPRDMVESILAKLPIPDLFRARAISTSMNNVVEDHILHGGDSGFMRITGREEVDRVHGLMIFQYSRCRELYYNIDEPLVFNPCTQEWHKLPRISSYLPMRTMSTHMIVGGGGLLCIGDLVLPHRTPMPNKSLYICNPLTKRWRKLPYPPCRLPCFSGNRGSTLMVDKATNSYRIVFFLKLALNRTCSLVYFSETESWRLTEHFNQLNNIRTINIVANNDDENHGGSNSATCGLLRILVENCLTGRLGIQGFDVEKATWTHQVAYIDAVEPQLRLCPYMMWHLRSVGTLLLTSTWMSTYLVIPWSCSDRKVEPCTWNVVILKLLLQKEASQTTIKTEKLTEMDIEATTDDRRLRCPWFSWKANGRHFISMVHTQKGFMLTYDILSGVWSGCRIGCHDRIVAEAIPYQACWAQV